MNTALLICDGKPYEVIHLNSQEIFEALRPGIRKAQHLIVEVRGTAWVPRTAEVVFICDSFMTSGQATRIQHGSTLVFRFTEQADIVVLEEV